MGITEERIERITEQAAVIKELGKAYVDVSGELDALASDNELMEAKIQGLEEANARLRERLNRGENHDACMKLPLDADGVPIRIGDKMDIDGEIAVVKGYQVGYKGDELQFIAVTEGYRKTFTLFGKNRKHFKHDTMPSDSWEKLEEDAAKEVCVYAGAPFSIVNQDMYSCTGCRFDDCSSRKTSCWLQMNSELMARAKRLAGAEVDDD